MTTEQKAREWFKKVAKFIQPTATELDAKEIITALLAERQALLGALKFSLTKGSATAKEAVIRRAIAMCEDKG